MSGFNSIAQQRERKTLSPAERLRKAKDMTGRLQWDLHNYGSADRDGVLRHLDLAQNEFDRANDLYQASKGK